MYNFVLCGKLFSKGTIFPAQRTRPQPAATLVMYDQRRVVVNHEIIVQQGSANSAISIGKRVDTLKHGVFVDLTVPGVSKSSDTGELFPEPTDARKQIDIPYGYLYHAPS